MEIKKNHNYNDERIMCDFRLARRIIRPRIILRLPTFSKNLDIKTKILFYFISLISYLKQTIDTNK